MSLRSPVTAPPAILAIGMNYRAHVAEMGREPPEYQYWFNKQRTSIAGPGDPIVLPAVSSMVDYEGELAMVIARRCQHVPAARAMEVVAGFTIINDVSARDWQWRTPTFTVGKSFDSHAPCGPWLVTTDELGDPGDLSIRTWVNDELRQDSSTADLIFNCSRNDRVPDHRLPARGGHHHRHRHARPAWGPGSPRPSFLADGDVVRIAIEGIGELTNPGGPGRSRGARRPQLSLPGHVWALGTAEWWGAGHRNRAERRRTCRAPDQAARGHRPDATGRAGRRGRPGARSGPMSRPAWSRCSSRVPAAHAP